MSKLWLDGSGKLLVDGSGHPYDCTYCPCDDYPSECPEDLPEEYSLTAFSMQVLFYVGPLCTNLNLTRDMRIKSGSLPVTLTKVGGECCWAGPADFEASDNGGSWYDYFLGETIQVCLTEYGWQLVILTAGALKDGGSPDGEYAYDSGCMDETGMGTTYYQITWTATIE
jgi:hypothetical protein